MRSCRVAGSAIIFCAVALAMAGCGSSSARPEELSDRLTQVMQDTVAATRLARIEHTDKRELQACTAPLKPGEASASLVFYFPTVDLDEARKLMREMYDYWQLVAPEWSRKGFDVVEDGIDTKGTPAVYLHIDGFSLSASFFPDADVAEFVFGGSAPCAEYPERE
jgi:hypothetical protein